MNGNGATINYNAELWRKAIHLSSLSYPVLYAVWLDKTSILLILGSILLFGIFVEYFRFRNTATRAVIEKFFGFMMREHELDGQSKNLSGATYVVLAGIIVFWFFPKDIAIYAFSMLIVGDASAAVIGRRFGRLPLLKTGKTWEGSGAFFLASMVVALFLPSLSWPLKIAGAVAATIIELLPLPVDDNLTIPLGSAIIMTLLVTFAGL